MPRSQPNSMIQRGGSPVRIEEGRIVNVDMTHWTADVVTKNSQRQLIDLQWASGYFHFTGGEGIYVMPEVGAMVKVCMPSDGPPFILCFVTTFEREQTNSPDSDGGGLTSLQPDTTTSSETPREVTYRSGRPKLEQGDIMLRTRDGNTLWLHRGGVVEIGSSGVAKRYFIPLLNTIRDICENYELVSLGGELSWTVTRADENPEGSAEAAFTLASRNFAQDEFATVFLRVGHVDGSDRLKLLVAPNRINPRTGVVNGEPVFEFVVNESGDLDCTVKGDATITVKGNLSETVEGDATFGFQGNLSENVSGDQSTSITGGHSLEANSSTERLAAGKTIDAQNIKLGQGAIFPVMILSPVMMAYIMFHTHPVAGSATGPPTTPPPESMIKSRKAFAE